MMEQEDWRLSFARKDLLAGKPLYHVPYRPRSASDDHDHCEFCFDKFMDHPDCLRLGYCTQPENGPGARWICPGCFGDFREMFDWTLTGE